MSEDGWKRGTAAAGADLHGGLDFKQFVVELTRRLGDAARDDLLL